MQSVRKSVLVAHSSAEMFELVDRIDLYPEFLPWCAGAQVLETHANGKTARIDIDYAGVRAHFTTDNRNRAGESIVVTLRDGPFRHLHGEWHFMELAPDGCKVALALASRLCQKRGWHSAGHSARRLLSRTKNGSCLGQLWNVPGALTGRSRRLLCSRQRAWHSDSQSANPAQPTQPMHEGT